MTPQDLRAVIGQLVDAAAQQRIQGSRDHARGLMDAADRLRRFLPAQTPPSPSQAAPASVAAPEPVAEAPDAVDEPPKPRRARKPKGV